jgi:hypothetical protein
VKAVILVWRDREGRVWLDTGQKDPASREVVIELSNGDVRGALGWVAKNFGPLENLSAQRQENRKRRGLSA